MAITFTQPAAELRLFRTTFGNITAKTANYTITADESGTIFTNQAAAGSVFFTLPAQATGLWYLFANVELQNMTIVADTVDTIAAFNDVAADNVSYSTANEQCGGGFLVFSDATNWVVLPLAFDSQTQTVGT